MHTWYDDFCETVIYIIQPRVRKSHLDATTEQNADLDSECLELRTTLHVVYARKTKQTLASTIVSKVPTWIRQQAVELLKKQIASYIHVYAKTC